MAEGADAAVARLAAELEAQGATLSPLLEQAFREALAAQPAAAQAKAPKAAAVKKRSKR